MNHVLRDNGWGVARPSPVGAGRTMRFVCVTGCLTAALVGGPAVPLRAQTTTVTYTYDALGRLTQAQSPGQLYQYTYDAAGNILTMVVASPAYVSSVLPSTAVAGAAAFTLQVDGVNFVAGAVVQWGGSARPTTFVSATRLTATVVAADVATPGTVVVTVLNPGATPVSNGIEFRVTAVRSIALTPTTLRFAGTNTNGTLSPMTGGQPVTVTVGGAGAAPWAATANQPWVQITNGSGTGSGTFTASVINPGDVLAGVTQASATITVTASGVSNSPQTVTVYLSLREAAANVAPFGLVDTPLQNAAGVVGTIGVTGWVLDDVGVTGVKVYRNCLAFEPAANCVIVHGAPVVFVGDATLVTGARPDVEGLFASYPQANRAAWGYLLLTNLLPHVPSSQMFGGQGPLTLYALATDVEGKQTWLGRAQGDTTPTMMTLANDTIAVPFGAIDTPAQGQTVSGQVVNFGWALTPDSNTTAEAGDILVPLGGSTMQVFVDGVLQGAVAYNQCRGTVLGPMPAGVYCDDDVSSIFGNLTPLATFTPRTANETKHRNLDVGRGAIGAFILNTTTLANGVHTIVWGVTDSGGRAEGIGSRYFTVLNSGADAGVGQGSLPTEVRGFSPADDRRAAGVVRASSPADAAGDTGAGGVMGVAQGFSPAVTARTGFDLGAPWVDLAADDAGVRRVQLPEFGRLELRLGPVDAGYLAANGELRDLPPGSHLDAATGHFTWAPGVGYYGTYRLTFTRAGAPIVLDVTIGPMAAVAPGEAEIRMHVDAPAAGAEVSGPFTVAGWALDPQAAFGSGIEAVHVWATRMDVAGAAPVYLGAAAVGGVRPDVAAVFGPPFGAAGFSLTSDVLASGRYEVTVYVWNRRTARWEDARTVAVTVR